MLSIRIRFVHGSHPVPIGAIVNDGKQDERTDNKKWCGVENRVTYRMRMFIDAQKVPNVKRRP